MDVAAILAKTKLIQLGLHIILLLKLTSYLWPHDTPVADLKTCYDYIIVGCGTAGSILANRLIENGAYSVLVIEAGGDPPIESLYPSTFPYLVNSTYDWNFTSIIDGYTAQAHRNHHLELTSGKMLGGSSSLGHLLYIRGAPHDYDEWATKVKDNSWKYENLLKYFKKSEDLTDRKVLRSSTSEFHGTDGNMGVSKHPKHITKKYLHAFEQDGNKILKDGNGDKIMGYFEPMFMIKDGVRQSMAHSFLTEIKHCHHLHMLKETEAIEIIFDGNKAIGVTAVKDGKILELRAKKEVIISAGAIKTPQLLMLSGIGITDDLKMLGIPVKRHLPVGKGFQDHLGVILVHKLKIKNIIASPPNPHDYPLPIVIGNVALNKTQTYPDYQSFNYIITSDSENLLSLCSVSYSFNDEVCQSLYNRTKGYETMLSKIVLLHPQSRGHVVLQSKDYKESPIVISGYYSHEEDLQSINNYIADFRRIVNTEIFQKFEAEFVYPKLKDCDGLSGSMYWNCFGLNMVGTSYHYSSTCAMGKVVDSRLRVIGMQNLRIVDASVMPLIPSGNTQAAVMAIAEKGADMILEDAKDSST